MTQNIHSKSRQPFAWQERHYMVIAQVSFANKDGPSIPRRQCSAPRSSSSNCFRITSLAGPCALTLFESHPYGKPGGGGHLGSHAFARRGDPFTPNLPRLPRVPRGASRGRLLLVSTIYKLLPIFTPPQLPLFPTASKLPNLQFLCFDNVATAPGGGTLLAP